MPVVKRFGSVKICIYGDDHAPPHLHIIANERETIVRISDLTVMAGIARREMAQAFQWAEQHKDLLKRNWKELNKEDNADKTVPPH